MYSLVVSALTVCLAVGLAIESRAQDVVLPMKLTLKTVRPGVNGLELKPAKATLDAKDVFELCVGLPPTQGQGLVVGMDCGVAEDGIVAFFDKNTGSGLPIGEIDFDYARSVATTVNGGSVKARIVPFTLAIDCASNIEVTATGVADITLETDGDFCPKSVKAKITGLGDIDPLGLLLVDEGSSFSASGPIPLMSP